MPRSRSSSFEFERPFGHLLIGAKRARLAQHRVDQGGFPVIDMGDDRDITDIHTVPAGSPAGGQGDWGRGSDQTGLGGELR